MKGNRFYPARKAISARLITARCTQAEPESEVECRGTETRSTAHAIDDVCFDSNGGTTRCGQPHGRSEADSITATGVHVRVGWITVMPRSAHA